MKALGLFVSSSLLSFAVSASPFAIQDKHAFGYLEIRDNLNTIISQNDDKYDWGATVIRDTDGLYKMWWTRQSPNDRIWYADSVDGIHWHHAQQVMAPANGTSPEQFHVADPSVVKLGGVYYMFYEAPNNAVNGQSQIFLATSSNGVSWSKTPNNTNPQPVVALPAGTPTNAYGIGMPSVFYKDSQFHMFYMANLTGWPDQIRHAVTSNPASWGAATGHTVAVQEGAAVDVTWNTALAKYVMLYTISGTDTGGSTINLYTFTSSDGTTWSNGVTDTYQPSLWTISNSTNDITSSGFGNPRTRGMANFVNRDTNGIVNTSSMLFYTMDGDMFDAGADWKQKSDTWNLYAGTVKLDNNNSPLNFHEGFVFRDTSTGSLYKLHGQQIHPYINWGEYTLDNPGRENEYNDIAHSRVIQHTQGKYWAERLNMYRPATGQLFYIENFTIYTYSSWAHYTSYPGNISGNWFSVSEAEFSNVWNDLAHGPYRP